MSLFTDHVMQNRESPTAFDQGRASSYDKQISKMAPMRDALQFLIRMVLSELPAKAQVLCVGVGTGSELIDLALEFPQWRFTAVDPAAPMLKICSQRAEESGIASRCTFHEGYLDSLPESEPFDAATCLLVSHFLTQPGERRNLFCQIATRLGPGGYLVSADLASDMSTSAFKSLFEVWMQTMKFSGIPAKELEKRRASCGRNVAVIPPQEVESIITSSGFETPVLFLQTLLIHAWYSRLAA